MDPLQRLQKITAERARLDAEELIIRAERARLETEEESIRASMGPTIGDLTAEIKAKDEELKAKDEELKVALAELMRMRWVRVCQAMLKVHDDMQLNLTMSCGSQARLNV